MMQESPPRRRLLLLSWPGLDWAVAQPLVDAGRMPQLESLILRGAMGKLAGGGMAASASLSTTLATGCHADAHGVLGWLKPGPAGTGVLPLDARDLLQPPLWQLVNQAGARACAVGWPMSHPATCFDGVVVSDAFAEARGASFDRWPLQAGAVQPPTLAADLADLRLHPSEVTAEQILPFIPLGARIDQQTDERLPLLVATLARAAGVHGAGTWLAARDDWDLLAVHFELVERLSSAFTDYRPPRMAHVSALDFDIFNGVVDGAYQFMDMLLGRYLQLVDQQTHVLLVSDHGFFNDHLRPLPGSGAPADAMTRRYKPLGVLVAAGPGIRHDQLVFGATLLDIVPTAMHLLGLPLPSAFEGQVLNRMLDPTMAAAAAPEAARAPDLSAADAAPGWHPQPNATPDAGHDTAQDSDRATAQDSDRATAQDSDRATAQDSDRAVGLLRELVATGYVLPPAAHPEAAAEDAAIARLQALARVKTARGRHAEALAVLQDLLVLAPDHPPSRLATARCHFALGDTVRCRALVDDLVSGGLHGPLVDYLLGQLCLKEGKLAQARRHLQQAQAAGGSGRGLLERIGRVHLQAQDWDAAEQAFRQALGIDADFALAHNGLGVALGMRGQHEQAIQHLLQSIGLLYQQADAHYHLGCSLAAVGRMAQAVAAFDNALGMQPGFEPARLAQQRARMTLVQQAIGDANARRAPG